MVGRDGKLHVNGPTDRAGETFTSGFTRKFPQLAARSPAFAQLRNLIDMTVAAAFIQQQRYAGKAGWTMETLLDEKSVSVKTLATPTRVAAAVNSVWKGARFYGLSGGVSIRPYQALAADRMIADKDGKLKQLHSGLVPTPPKDRWWWD